MPPKTGLEKNKSYIENGWLRLLKSSLFSSLFVFIGIIAVRSDALIALLFIDAWCASTFDCFRDIIHDVIDGISLSGIIIAWALITFFLFKWSVFAKK